MLIDLDESGSRILCLDVDSLPNFMNADLLFLDVETTNNHDVKSHADYPWNEHHEIAGIAVTAGTHPKCYYIPIRHLRGDNADVGKTLRWLKEVLGTSKRWVNHNITFDSTFCYMEGADFGGELYDTLTMSKILDSDRMGYGLKVLAKDWLSYDTSSQDRLSSWLKAAKVKAFGAAPSDLVGYYACDDVAINRSLYHHILEHLPEDQNPLVETEIKLTAVLHDMQVDGLRVDPMELKKELYRRLRSIVALEERFEKLIGRVFTDSRDANFDVLINQFGIPILAYKEKKDEYGKPSRGNPTFDGDALQIYAMHPLVTSNPLANEYVTNLAEYRDHKYIAGHLQSWVLDVDAGNYLHPRYNQSVRTGRMSSSRPNVQGLNKLERRFFLPDDGEYFISCDYSQIEFRLIVHYIKDWSAIEAYNDNPDTDFHQWVADLCGVGRSPAKRLNFGMGYGAGKAKVTSGLAREKVIIESVTTLVQGMIERGEIAKEDATKLFNARCAELASGVYETYHSRLPGVKRTSNDAARVCANRGYIINAYGRRRHLPKKLSRKAFNAIVQGSAMDIMKERMVSLSPRFNSKSRELGLRVRINVHDEVTFSVPRSVALDPGVRSWLLKELETPSVQFRVPIRCGLGISGTDWAEASGEEAKEYDDHVVGSLVGAKKTSRVAGLAP